MTDGHREALATVMGSRPQPMFKPQLQMRQYLFVSLLAEGPTRGRSGRQQVRGGAGSFKKTGGKIQVEDTSMGRCQSSKVLDSKFTWIFLQRDFKQFA